MTQHTPWRTARLLPDADDGWTWARTPVLGVSSLTRVLTALRRAGIERVSVGPGAEGLPEILATEKRLLPEVVFEDAFSPPEGETGLFVRGGFVFGPGLVSWFTEAAAGLPHAAACLHGGAKRPVLETLPAGEDAPPNQGNPSHVFLIPERLVCEPIERLTVPGGDARLLGLTGKPTDRPHVRWVRSWSFPGLRWLAAHRVTPNTVSAAGFVVGLFGCALLAWGGYRGAVAGALVLYGSWVLDCMDGTLARLTLAESELGQKIDTVLGNITNMAVFGALVWSVYGREAPWKAFVAAAVILVGIFLALRLSAIAKSLKPAPSEKARPGGLALFLEKLNHRDYAVVLFVLALTGGLKVFLWAGLVGVQVFWLLQLLLIAQYRKAAKAQ